MSAFDHMLLWVAVSLALTARAKQEAGFWMVTWHLLAAVYLIGAVIYGVQSVT